MKKLILTKEELQFLQRMIDRDFPSIQNQNRADELLDKVSLAIYGKKVRDL